VNEPGVAVSKQGSADGHDESSLFGTACNLHRHKAYSFLVGTGRKRRFRHEQTAIRGAGPGSLSVTRRPNARLYATHGGADHPPTVFRVHSAQRRYLTTAFPEAV